MAEENAQNGDADLQAPAALAEALRRLQKPVVFVPPQVDEAALSGPRLHLARIRQLAGGASGSRAADRQDLALAARTSEHTVRPSQFSSRDELGPMEHLRPRRVRQWNLLPWIIILALIAAALLFFAVKNRANRPRFNPAIPGQTVH